MLIFYLNNILKKENVSQTKFAEISDVRPNTINDICNNNTKRLEINTLEKILSALLKMGYSMDDFMKYKQKNERVDNYEKL